MLKMSSKRRRTTKQINAEKAAKEQNEQQVKEKLAMFEQLQTRVQPQPQHLIR